MIIRSIKIRNLGAIDTFEYDFEDDLNIVKARCADEIYCAIQLVLNHRTSHLPKMWVSGSTRIEALVSIAQKEYLLIAKPDLNRKKLCIYAFDEFGKENTREYLYLTAHCAEQDICEVFDKDDKNFFKPIHYLDKDGYYNPRKLSKCTDGASEIKAFHRYLKTFVKNFKSETVCEGKRYELCMDENGKYIVQYKDENDEPVFLSESEQILFRYLCFLKTAEFWHGFEALRNLNCVKKPILIKDFLERLDEAIDTSDIMKRTMQLERQIILLTA